jgi:hypothetical protein
MSEWTVNSGAEGAVSAEPWQELYRYWLSKHAEGQAPARGDLDPVVEIPRLVANLMILEVMADGYEYRLVGSEIVMLAGVDLTNRRAGSGAKFAAIQGEWIAALDFVRDNRTPRLLFSSLGTQPAATNTVLLLPLRAAPGENMKILGALFRQGAFDAKLTVDNLSVREIPH